MRTRNHTSITATCQVLAGGASTTAQGTGAVPTSLQALASGSLPVIEQEGRVWYNLQARQGFELVASAPGLS